MNVATRRQISARSAASEQSNPFISPVPSTALALLRCEPDVVARRRLGRRDLHAGAVGDLEDRMPLG